MVLASLAAALDELDRLTRPAVLRFDSDAPLFGRVAVLPAAFNPPTLAHLHLLEAALGVPGVGSTAAMLTTRNVAKPVTGATLDQRVDMLLAAREGGAGPAVLAANAARIVDQATALRATFPAARFDFVVGYDTLVRLFDARYYTDMGAELLPFFSEHRVIAANRGEHGIEGVRSFIAERAGPFAARVVSIEIGAEPASFSSTHARERAGQGTESEQVPSAVARFIARHGLYR